MILGKTVRHVVLLISLLSSFLAFAETSKTLCPPTIEPSWVWKSYHEILNERLNSKEHQSEFEARWLSFKHYGQPLHADVAEQLGLLARKTGLQTSVRELFLNFQKLQLMNVQLHNQQNPEDPIDVKNDLLRPGVLFFKSKNGNIDDEDAEWLTVGLDSDVPKGFLPFDLSNSNTLPPGRALYAALANGYFPVTIDWKNPKVSAHDIMGHLISYILYPEYARSYRAVVQKLVQTVSKNMDQGLDRPWKFFYRTGLFGRVYTLNESMVLVNKSLILGQAKSLGLDNELLNSNALINYDLVHPKATQFKTFDHLKRLFSEVEQLALKSMVPMGGASLVSTRAVYTNSPYDNILFYLLDFGRYLTSPEDVVLSSPDNMKNLRAQLRRVIGLIRGYIVNMSRYDINSIPTEIFNDSPSPTSPNSFFWSKDSGFFKELTKIFNADATVDIDAEENLPQSRFGIHWDERHLLQDVRNK